MKNNFLLLLLLTCLDVHSQIGLPDNRANGSVQLSSSLFFEEILGKPISSAENKGINGSAFLKTAWSLSTVRLKDGHLFANIPIKLNLYTGDVHYLSSDKRELVAPQGIITGFEMPDTVITGEIKERSFVNLLPVGTETKNPWYEIAENGKASLLLHTTVKINEIKTLGSTEVEKDFLHIDDAYILLNEQLLKCKKEKSFFPGLMTDKKEAIGNFIDTNKLKCKSTDDFKTIIHYYNSLFTKKVEV